MKVLYVSEQTMQKCGGFFAVLYATLAGMYDFLCNEIYINRELSRWTQFWTFLHEFGHWVMCRVFKLHPQYPRLNLFITDFYDLISVAVIPFSFKDKLSFILWRLNNVKDDLFGKLRVDYSLIEKYYKERCEK